MQTWIQAIMHTNICIHTNMHTHANVHTGKHMHTSKHANTCTHKYAQTCAHIQIHAHTYMTHEHTHACNIHAVGLMPFPLTRDQILPGAGALLPPAASGSLATLCAAPRPCPQAAGNRASSWKLSPSGCSRGLGVGACLSTWHTDSVTLVFSQMWLVAAAATTCLGLEECPPPHGFNVVNKPLVALVTSTLQIIFGNTSWEQDQGWKRRWLPWVCGDELSLKSWFRLGGVVQTAPASILPDAEVQMHCQPPGPRVKGFRHLKAILLKSLHIHQCLFFVRRW